MRRVKFEIISGLIFLVLTLGVYVLFSNDVIRFNLEQDDSLAAESQAEIKVDITINGKDGGSEKYNTTVINGQTAIDALTKLDKDSDQFVYEYKEDPSFGAYVTSINGVKAAEKEFWAFKVNGQDSNLGISSYNVKDGDMLSFTLSKF